MPCKLTVTLKSGQTINIVGPSQIKAIRRLLVRIPQEWVKRIDVKATTRSL